MKGFKQRDIMKGFLIGALMIGVTVGLYLSITSAKTQHRNKVPSQEVPVQLGNLDEDSAKSYFNCDKNNPKGLLFTSDQELHGNVRITFVSADTNHVFKTNYVELFDKINNSDLGNKAGIKFTNFKINYYVDSNLNDYAVNMFSLLKVVREMNLNDDYLDFLVVADGIVFQQEKYTGPIYGVAEDIVSTAFLMRDGYTMIGEHGGITIHEILHCLGLYHTHSDDDSNRGLNCVTGDKIPTTVKVNPNSVFSFGTISGCEWSPVDTSYTEAERLIIVHNFMSYSHPECLSSLEDEQVDTIRQTIENNLEFRRIFNLERKSRYESIFEEIKQ